MGFWSFLDKAVGFIPIVGTIKDGVEAAVLELEGKHEAAKEKAMEAVIDLACDVVTVATMGEGYEVAAIGKVAAEAAMKDIVEQGAKEAAKDVGKAATKTVAKDVAEQGAKDATKDVGKAAAETTTKDVEERGGKDALRQRTDSVSTAATLSDLDVEATISHERSASTAAALKEGHNVDHIAKAASAAYEEAKEWGFSDSTANVIAAADAAINAKKQARKKIHGEGTKGPDTETEKKKKEPSQRGEHVINNGVRKVFQNMIERFLEINHVFFENKTFAQLRMGPETRVYQSYKEPLTPQIDERIEKKLKVTADDEYVDTNATQYGIAMVQVSVVIMHYMNAVLNSLRQRNPPSVDRDVNKAVADIVERINARGREVYVDRDALRIWRRERRSEAEYVETRDAVAAMFNLLLPHERRVMIWVSELYRAR